MDQGKLYDLWLKSRLTILSIKILHSQYVMISTQGERNLSYKGKDFRLNMVKSTC